MISVADLNRTVDSTRKWRHYKYISSWNTLSVFFPC